MKWIQVNKLLPNDDETVVVYNHFEGYVSIMAYYDKESNQFYPIHSLNSFPVVVTHWLSLTPYPEEDESPKET